MSVWRISRRSSIIWGAVLLVMFIATSSLVGSHLIEITLGSDDPSPEDSQTRKPRRTDLAIVGGFHVLGERDVPVSPIVMVLDAEYKVANIPRERGTKRKRHDPTATTPQMQASAPYCPSVVWSEDDSSAPARMRARQELDASAPVPATYDITGPAFAPLRGLLGRWPEHFNKAIEREFAGLRTTGDGLASSVPLLQPLWGTLEYATHGTIAPSRTLAGPPSLLKASSTHPCPPGWHPLIILTARRVQALRGRQHHLQVPPTLAFNILSLAAESLLATTRRVTPTFSISVLLSGNTNYVGLLAESTMQDLDLWGLLGLSNVTEAGRIFRAALADEELFSRIDLIRSGTTKIMRVRPGCGAGAGGDCPHWCDEVTAVIPLEIRAEAGDRVATFAVHVSVVEFACDSGAAAPTALDSFAAAVHLASIVGDVRSATHVVLLEEGSVVHSLQRPDRRLFSNAVGDQGGGVGHRFLEQLLGPWGLLGNCSGPKAAQGVTLRHLSPSTPPFGLAFKAGLGSLVVDSHGLLFTEKTLAVPSFPSGGVGTVSAGSSSPSVQLPDMVNSMFHPFTRLAGVVPIKRRHLLPARSRRVIGVVNAAEVNDALTLQPRGTQSIEVVDAMLPHSLAIDGPTFVTGDGLLGWTGTRGEWVPLVEDVLNALRSRIVPLVSQLGGGGRGCSDGEGAVVGAVLRSIRVAARLLLGSDIIHTSSEFFVYGMRLSHNLRSFSLPPAPQRSGRLTLAEIAVAQSPLVAVSARLVRVTPFSRAKSDASVILDGGLWEATSPHFAHLGLSVEVYPNASVSKPPSPGAPIAELRANARRVARMLYLLVLGAPTSVCVPGALLSVVEQHFEAVATSNDQPGETLQGRLRRAFHPWQGTSSCGTLNFATCVSEKFIRHANQMLACDGMGEWLRRVGDNMHVLSFPSASLSKRDFEEWERTAPAGSEFGDLRAYYLSAWTEASRLYEALCQRWGCQRAAPTHQKKMTLLTEPSSMHIHSDVPGIEIDTTSTVVGRGVPLDVGVVSSFFERALVSPFPNKSTQSLGEGLAMRMGMESGNVASVDKEAALGGPFLLWQQWALRYLRLLLGAQPPPAAPAGDQVLRPLACSTSRVFHGQWASMVKTARDARATISVDFAVSRLQPSIAGGAGPVADALAKLLAAKSFKAALEQMNEAMRLVGVAELTPLLRALLLQEGQVPRIGCFSAVRRLHATPMYLSRAVVATLRTKAWEMGADSIVDLLDGAKAARSDCAVRGLAWLDKGWEEGGGGKGDVETMLETSTDRSDPAEMMLRLAERFAEEHKCVLPPSMLTQLSVLAKGSAVGTPAQRVCDAVYHRLQMSIFRTAIELVDTSGTLLLQARRLATTYPSQCSSKPVDTSPPSTFTFSFRPGERILFRVPCFGCSGFTRETVLYLPPLIEDKGLPMSLSVGDTACICMDPPSGKPNQQPQDMYVRARSLSCDNRCMPFLTSGTTVTLDNRELGRPIWSGELYADERTHVSAFYAQRQRHYREPVEREINIMVDSINPDMLYSTDLEVSGFAGIDVPSRWNEERIHPPPNEPIDKAIARSLFKGYIDLGVPSSDATSVVNPQRRLYRICRVMYEADRISFDWMHKLKRYCDELWVPANWVRRMFINSFVIPQIEIDFVSRSGAASPHRPCMGCVVMSRPTTDYKPFIFDSEEAAARGVLGRNQSLRNLQRAIADDERWASRWVERLADGEVGHANGLVSSALSRLLLDGARRTFPATRAGIPVAQFAGASNMSQGEICIRLSHPIAKAIQDGLAHLLSVPHGSSAGLFEIGNSTHVLSARMRFASLFDLDRIVVIPEALDINSMDPVFVEGIDKPSSDGMPPPPPDHSPAPSSTERPGLFQPGDPSYGWERWCSRRCFKGPKGSERFLFRNESFRFYSVFKWEPRKGWRELLESFYRAFYSPLYSNRDHGEPMLMILGSSYTPKADTFESIFLSQQVNNLAREQRWPISLIGEPVQMAPEGVVNYAGRRDFPCMCFVAESVSEEDIAALYKSVDALVVTTKGEGWGLPGSESMAMGLPVISSNWGGSTEFMTLGSVPESKSPVHGGGRPFAYTVNVTLDEVPSLATGYGGEAGMRMASPSISHTVQHLREVYSQGSHINHKVGARARDVIVRHFSQAATTDLMTARMAAVTQSLRDETPEDFELAMDRQRERLVSARLV